MMINIKKGEGQWRSPLIANQRLLLGGGSFCRLPATAQ